MARQRQASQNKDLLQTSLDAYDAMFRQDPTSYYNGDNAAALSLLHHHLTAKWPATALSDGRDTRDIQDLLSAVRWSARAALAKASDDFWARSTLGNVAVMEGRLDEALAQYRLAILDREPDRFALDSVAQQLRLFRDLGFQTKGLHCGARPAQKAGGLAPA